MLAHVSAVPVAPSQHGIDLPDGLDEVILRALAKEPATRPHAAALAAALSEIAASVPVAVAVPEPVPVAAAEPVTEPPAKEAVPPSIVESEVQPVPDAEPMLFDAESECAPRFVATVAEPPHNAEIAPEPVAVAEVVAEAVPEAASRC
jgi:hypothetical protein